MVWPILISASVIPGALSARAGQAPVAVAAAAAALDAKKVRRVFMIFLSGLRFCGTAADGRRFSLFGEMAFAHAETRSPNSSQLSPLNLASCICRINLKLSGE